MVIISAGSFFFGIKQPEIVLDTMHLNLSFEFLSTFEDCETTINIFDYVM